MSHSNDNDPSQQRLSSQVSQADIDALPPTFGDQMRIESKQKQHRQEDVAMENQDNDDQRDLNKESKAKITKYLDDMKLRDEAVAGTFGENGNQFNFQAEKNKVDAACSLENIVVMSDYSCMLIREDVSLNEMIQVRVCKLQLLERNDKQKWTVWQATGKVSEAEVVENMDLSDFKTEIFEHYNKIDAEKNFEKRFFERSSNKWAEREYFKEKEGKFKLFNPDKKIRMIKEAQDLEKDLVQTLTESDQKFKSKLSPELVEMTKEIFNFGAMKKYMSELGLDVDKMPIGKMTKDKIKRGHILLCQIQNILVVDETKKQHSKVLALTNDFYHTIPHNFGMKKPPVIDHLLRVKEKTRMLEQLQNIVEMQQIYLKALTHDLKHDNPSDVLYTELCTKLTKLDDESDHFNIIYQAVNNTQADVHQSQFDVQVRGIYEAFKPSEKLRFTPFENKMHNKFLLWQGVKPQGLASTLRDGVRMPVSESAVTGYMFGKGIYFTDCFSKAAMQSLGPQKKQGGQSQRAFIILSEVALGDMHKTYAPHQFKRSPPMFCHSVYGVGQFKPKQVGIKDLKQDGPDFLPNQQTFDKPNALFLNTGKMGQNSDLDNLPTGMNQPDLKFNEFVVYDNSQIKMRYMVDCEIIFR